MNGRILKCFNVVILIGLFCFFGQAKAIAGANAKGNRMVHRLSVTRSLDGFEYHVKRGNDTKLSLNYGVAPGFHASLKTNDQSGADHKNLATVAGWVGTVAYILAYLLLSLDRIKSNHPLYHLFNILGAIGLIWNALHLYDYPNVIVNGVWLSIALMALILIARRRIRQKNSVD